MTTRKLAVEHNLRSETDLDTITAVLELKVVESALRRNSNESYGAWHHLKWALNMGLSSLNHKFRLLDQFQKADSRNFHVCCRIENCENVPEEEELRFTMDMININFSNYSAWHNQGSGFIPREKVLTEEYDLVHQALFTDPDDQSGWLYHLWFLDQTVMPDAPVLISSWPSWFGFDCII